MDFLPGPVILRQVGDEYTKGCRIVQILWEGQTNANDIVEVRGLPGRTTSGYRIWKGRAVDTSTYAGISFGVPGIPCPYGFKLEQRDNGEVSVYIRQE